jgi:hypothetical protein
MQETLTETPFILWTQQGSGSLNLYNHLDALSLREGLPAEPFNTRGMHGDISKVWRSSRDDDAVRGPISSVCAAQVNITHSIDTVPWAINKALIEQTARAGYAQLFFYHHDSLGRLLALAYAQRAQGLTPTGPDDPAFGAPLDVEKLVEQEEKSRKKFNKVWRQLRKAEAAPIAICAESLHLQERAGPRKLLAALGLDVTGKRVVEICETLDGESAKDRYSHFKGLEALEERLASLSPLIFARAPNKTDAAA